jgi:hypothetical protein
MARVISIHEYDLRPDADEAAFERAIRNAESTQGTRAVSAQPKTMFGSNGQAAADAEGSDFLSVLSTSLRRYLCQNRDQHLRKPPCPCNVEPPSPRLSEASIEWRKQR